MRTFYFAVSCVAVAALLLLDQIVKKSDTATISNKNFFRLAIWMVVIVTLAETATLYLEGAEAALRIPHLVANILGFSLSPLIPLAVGCAIDHHQKKALCLLAIPAVVNFLAAAGSAFWPLIFFVNAQNDYGRGPFFGVYVLAYTFSLCYLLIQTLSVIERYQNNNRSIPIMLFSFVAIGCMGQVLCPQLHISWLCISFAIVLYYMYCCDLLHQIDGLTGLLNRRIYEFNLSKLNPRKTDLAVIMFDIDDFKSINDRYGHPYGDHCLMIVSMCIKKAFFKLGLCFRVGGDEFCVLVLKPNRKAVEKACENFQEELDKVRREEERLPAVSVGWTLAQNEPVADVIAQADQKMYEHKRRHKSDLLP